MRSLLNHLLIPALAATALTVALIEPASANDQNPGNDFLRRAVTQPQTQPDRLVAPRPDASHQRPKPKGTTKMVVVQLTWAGRPMPDRTAQLTQDVIVNTNNWYRTVSHGKYGVTGQVTPLLTTHPMACGLSTHLLRKYERAARKAMKHAHYKLPKHRSRLVIALPCPATSYDGFGAMPGNVVWLYVDPAVPPLTPDLSDGLTVTGTQTKGSTWWSWEKWNLKNSSNQTGWESAGEKFSDPTILPVHEMGHNLGLNHSELLQCSQNGVPTSTTGHCTTVEYGDPYDTMAGIYAAGSFSAMRLKQLHWLDGGVAHVKRHAKTVRLAPLETAGGTKAITVKGKGGRTYWIEYRTQNGVDSVLDPAQVGVLIRYTAKNHYTKLIDAWPGSGRAWDYTNGVPGLTDAEQSQLRPGLSITVPGGITITTVAQDGTGATVQVTPSHHHKKKHHKKKHH
jgi:hypothetical protein